MFSLTFCSGDCIHLNIKEMHKKKKKNTFLNRTTNYLKCYYALKSHQSLPKEQLRQNGILLFGINCECIEHNSFNIFRPFFHSGMKQNIDSL